MFLFHAYLGYRYLTGVPKCSHTLYYSTLYNQAMLAEAVEDRIFELVDQLDELVKRNDGLDNLSDEIREEAVLMAKQTKALQVQYDDLVAGRPSNLLDLE